MNIKLRDLQLSDKEYFFQWIKDKEVIRYSLSIFQKMKSNNEIAHWFDMLLLDKSSYNKAIVDNANEKLIGYTGIAQISETNLSGEYFIFIGDKSYHGKGVGTFVTKEIVNRGFQELGLNRIMLTVSEKNIGAIKAYTKANFKIEGVMKQAFYREGKFHDKVIMAILR
ncbi:GNAT family N-acetyltransferase [Clostridium estertheticum]|uniref:GNAT family N-acetyltransferase n=1 Tax=Clostridium estertheticum TaxID=238834 RepID=UPI001CF3DF62|nr:GNAT family protein [Clostridium estertheticum]MCB2339143.1 GNAT family N-acetyltransferase [Clostridium estertheticum]